MLGPRKHSQKMIQELQQHEKDYADPLNVVNVYRRHVS